MAPEPSAAVLARPRPGARALVAAAILLAGLLALAALGLGPSDLGPTPGGLAVAGRFFGAALAPDLSTETLGETLAATGTTLLLAAAAMGLALVLGVGLGFLGSTAWWADDPAGGAGPVARALRRTLLPALYVAVRVLIAAMRSVHELLWAVLFNAALGLHPVAAVVAIAIPYGGTLAKVFGEMVDEAPRDVADALRGAGASPAQVFLFGLLPRALPDMASYAFYRFECAIRSSAVLGFFGYLTLGYHLGPAFASGRYSTAWTYLYAILVLVVVVDLWSGRLRRRFVA